MEMHLADVSDLILWFHYLTITSEPSTALTEAASERIAVRLCASAMDAGS